MLLRGFDISSARKDGSTLAGTAENLADMQLRPLEQGRSTMSGPTPHPTLLCRAHLHHKWVPARAEDGGQYIRCAHCGKDKSEIDPGDSEGRRQPWQGFGRSGSI
jgi:hypothetical protein